MHVMQTISLKFSSLSVKKESKKTGKYGLKIRKYIGNDGVGDCVVG